MEATNFIITEQEHGQRIDMFLSSKTNFSRTIIKKLIKQEEILLNNKKVKPSQLLKEDDTITISKIEKITDAGLVPENIHLEIIYEDEDILLINKPIGLIVHPGAGTNEPTLAHALIYHYKDLPTIGGEDRPGIVHRLDKDTGGIMIISKNEKAYHSLTGQFKDRTVTKTYLALVHGELRRQAGKIDFPIGRHPQNRHMMKAFKTADEKKKIRTALTEYKVISLKDNKSLLEISIYTGRTHQIRVHLKTIGHPVCGDPIYGNQKGRGKRQLLHAFKLEFNHPTTNERMTFTTPPPKWVNPYVDDIAHLR